MAKCKECKLYDPKNKTCSVVILVEGEKWQITPEPNDDCFYTQEFRAYNDETHEVERFKLDVQQIKVWVEDPKTGKKTTDGVVKIEYPVPEPKEES